MDFIQLRTNPLFAKAQQHLEIEPEQSNQPKSYLRLDKRSMDSFLTHADELNTIIDNSIQCRRSELELVFQVKDFIYNKSEIFSYSFRNVPNEM